ncbi:neuroglobin-like isoform X3 [Biomphalaria glabrata]|uniref:Globin n=1 Tax=Biomphalaria glabrata TaxID=6526 RepID=A0A2C9JZ04_BIOGL|nr:neuroglobin-like isoform X3 [Biomphalaria glabrata]
MGCLFSHIGPYKEKCLISSNGVQCREEDDQEGSDGSCAGYAAVGISYKQGFSLKQSWKGIKRKMEDTGVEMFVRLFRSNSELQAMFKGFKDIKTDSELRSNEALENHATLVMTTLDDAITHIDNYEYVKDLLYRTSATHTKFTGFQPAYFMHVKEPFLEAVRVTLGDRYTDNMQNIYTIAITYVLQTLKEGMEEALK